jgi:hypothetical protein
VSIESMEERQPIYTEVGVSWQGCYECTDFPADSSVPLSVLGGSSIHFTSFMGNARSKDRRRDASTDESLLHVGPERVCFFGRHVSCTSQYSNEQSTHFLSYKDSLRT